jgi:hypothetical protein
MELGTGGLVICRYGKIPGQIEILVVIGANCNREQRAPII